MAWGLVADHPGGVAASQAESPQPRRGHQAPGSGGGRGSRGRGEPHRCVSAPAPWDPPPPARPGPPCHVGGGSGLVGAFTVKAPLPVSP